MKNYHISWKKICFICTMILIIVVALFFYHRTTQTNEISSDYSIPKNTKLVLHFSTLTDTTVNFLPNPTSQIYYYDTEGNIIKGLERDEEIMRDFIVEGDGTVAFLFKNNTILSNADGFTEYDPNSEVYINSDNFGPSQTGYIEDKKVFYSLLNVGQKHGEEYINAVRFISDTQNYDVIIPYHLENISYDNITKKIICVVSDLNDSLQKSTFKYVVLHFDGTVNQFVMEDKLYKISYDEHSYYGSDDLAFRTTMANNNNLYSVSVVDTEQFIKDVDGNKIRTHANLLLTTIDLENSISSDQILKENYVLDELGYGVLTGSDHLPMEVIGNKLYVFTSDFEMFIIESQNKIKKLKIPYEFQGSLSLYHPLKKKFNDKENFFGSEIKIGDDGNIYILNIFPNKVLKIHKLLEDSTYELFWQGNLPDIKRKDMFINTFKILNY